MSTALQPQQLESVSKDEDSLYGPLGRAKGKVERALTSDSEISPDLADMLSNLCEFCSSEETEEEKGAVLVLELELMRGF